MFVNAKFDQAIKGKALYSKSLYAREYELLHEFSASKHENVELEYSNSKQAAYAKNVMTRYIKNNKMSLKASQRQNFIYVTKSEVNKA
jgi:hypothetical protein